MNSSPPPPSNFEAFIDELFARDDRPAGAPRPNRFSINSLEAAWTLTSARAQTDEEKARPRHLYDREGDADDASGPACLLDPNKILLELGLDSSLSEADIAALRREFALRNHPDRVQSELKMLATQRMMIANDLMDRYVARLRNSDR
jgi:hypothetical protein